MEIQETGIEGLLILEPKVFRDSRGYFLESFRKSTLEAAGIRNEFIQDNQSRSGYGVIRGLHFQREPHAQAKLIRVLEGTIYDVAVDIRRDSSTFGEWFGLEISQSNQLQLLIPAGFAHGFSVLSEQATVFYKCDVYYNPESESGIRYNDPSLKINWKVDPSRAIISEKDQGLPYLKDL
jgi:dTDP-4-dehydrorhamnose 3,5-epimerase